jgi:hypothetical protein
VDSHCKDFIVTTLGGENIKTHVVRNRYIKNAKGQELKTPQAIRRALAHHIGVYKGSMLCKMCHGREEFELEDGQVLICRFCIKGVPKNVCGDCNEPLPGCKCLHHMMRFK